MAKKKRISRVNAIEYEDVQWDISELPNCIYNGNFIQFKDAKSEDKKGMLWQTYPNHFEIVSFENGFPSKELHENPAFSLGRAVNLLSQDQALSYLLERGGYYKQTESVGGLVGALAASKVDYLYDLHTELRASIDVVSTLLKYADSEPQGHFIKELGEKNCWALQQAVLAPLTGIYVVGMNRRPRDVEEKEDELQGVKFNPRISENLASRILTELHHEGVGKLEKLKSYRRYEAHEVPKRVVDYVKDPVQIRI